MPAAGRGCSAGNRKVLYQPKNAPVVGRIRAMSGEVSGVLVSFGYRF